MAICFDFLKSECFIFTGMDAFAFIFIYGYVFPLKVERMPKFNVRFVSMLNQAHSVYMYIYRKPDLKGNDELLEQVLCLSSFFSVLFLIRVFCSSQIPFPYESVIQ